MKSSVEAIKQLRNYKDGDTVRVEIPSNGEIGESTNIQGLVNWVKQWQLTFGKEAKEFKVYKVN